MKKAFTLIELTLVIVIVGILSTLLFRTVGEMIRANSRVQQEKLLAQEMINIQTTINSLSELYPYLDREQYDDSLQDQKGLTSILHLTNSQHQKISISGTGDCSDSCFLLLLSGSTNIAITNPEYTTLTGIVFKILPIQHYQDSQYEDSFDHNNISQPGFWILGSLSSRVGSGKVSKVSYTLQHFVNLQEQTIISSQSGFEMDLAPSVPEVSL